MERSTSCELREINWEATQANLRAAVKDIKPEGQSIICEMFYDDYVVYKERE